MIRYIFKRLLLMIPVVLGVAILIFTIMYFVPGDPADTILGAAASYQEKDALRESLGLNDPYLTRLGRFLADTFLRFDFGTSWLTKASVTAEIVDRFPRTLTLALICMVIRVCVGIPLGITAAVHQNGWADRFCMLVALVGISMPEFWVAIMLVILFSLRLGWLPSFGIGGIEYYVLPCIAGSLGGIAKDARQTRSSMLEVIRSDYITTARAKGLPESAIRYAHALPNALIPVVQVLGAGFSASLGGAIIIENVFSIPGMGTYMMTGVSNRDYPVVLSCVVLLAVTFSLVMLLVDIAFAYIDPRIKAQYEGQASRRSGGKKLHV